MARVKRYQRPLSIAMIDADFFKTINDQHGHDVGDMVLCSIVDVCHEGLRTNDVLARYGGEEFVVLLPETPCEGAQVVMDVCVSGSPPHRSSSRTGADLG